MLLFNRSLLLYVLLIILMILLNYYNRFVAYLMKACAQMGHGVLRIDAR